MLAHTCTVHTSVCALHGHINVKPLFTLCVPDVVTFSETLEAQVPLRSYCSSKALESRHRPEASRLLAELWLLGLWDTCHWRLCGTAAQLVKKPHSLLQDQAPSSCHAPTAAHIEAGSLSLCFLWSWNVHQALL